MCRHKNPNTPRLKTGRKRTLWPHILAVLKTHASRQHPMRLMDITATVNEQFEQSYLLGAVSRSIRREIREGAPVREIRTGRNKRFYWGGK
jgi:hypothetical protein